MFVGAHKAKCDIRIVYGFKIAFLSIRYQRFTATRNGTGSFSLLSPEKGRKLYYIGTLSPTPLSTTWNRIIPPQCFPKLNIIVFGFATFDSSQTTTKGHLLYVPKQ